MFSETYEVIDFSKLMIWIAVPLCASAFVYISKQLGIGRAAWYNNATGCESSTSRVQAVWHFILDYI